MEPINYSDPDDPIKITYLPSGRPNHMVVVIEMALEGGYDLKAIYVTCGCDNLKPLPTQLGIGRKVLCLNCQNELKPVKDVKQ